ncbi:hypothetical protein [Fibrobacter sp. UBA4297]|uniref:hypothetical protein n=1 Tax=Fibrobacter sp. UBA4297 TaxID=1946536 RepID=UPI001568B8FB|nr:hypothetical protein [Fibrobacter sp. UBA4297]
MKKSLKILLIVAASFLLVVAFYGYHLFRAISLDPDFYLSGDGSGGSESALSMLFFSQNLPKGIVCGTLPSHLRAEYLEPKEFMEIGTAADFLFRTHDESGRRTGYELSQRYEKDSLDGELRSKWGEGTVITRYVKEDSCFRLSKEIKAETADSVVSLKTSLSGDSSLYVGRRKNGIVTECVACKWHDGRCDEVISENKMELDPVSGKLLGYAFKTRETYVEGSLYVGNEFYADKMLFDSLQRLVEYEYGDQVFHYEYSSNDTANYSVNILDKSGRKVGFYKRKLKENRETVQYGTDRYEEEINRYFEDGKLIKETSEKNNFYESVVSRIKLFNPAGDEVLDSAFYEDSFLPGLRFDPHAFIVRHEYDENGKLKTYEQFQESFVKMFPFIFVPVKKESRKEVGKLKFDYDEAGRLKSITDESEDENMALRYSFPFAMRQIVYSKGKLENFEECKEPYDPLKRLKPKRRTPKQE